MKYARKLQKQPNAVNISLTLTREAYDLLNSTKVRVAGGIIKSRSEVASFAIVKCYGKNA